ncbi:MAG: argininosuccinate lyase [Nitrososphaerota archaeon]|nr:argininosuccinate lyase [Candidatus Nezhaarchaeota archaeon]MDW8049763.1 argininosuccinate lyase [Nitrososphaerota archaeon]
MWGARIRAPCKEALQYTSSIPYDDRIALDVVRINIAHLLMLVKQGIVSIGDGKALYKALRKLLSGFQLNPALEDVHMQIEDVVISEVGIDVGGKLHTGKSRNDQVATALRMTARRFILELALEVHKLREAIVSQSEKHIHTIMPGYTHLQHAQPTTLAHLLMAYHEKFKRDFDRLMYVFKKTDECPMGGAALAGSSFDLDRHHVARLLGFSGIQENTADAVSDRDFMVELAFSSAMIMIHLSELAEELILWSTWEFGFAEVPDPYSSTSSIMPQKKNPTVVEVVRARASHVLGMLMAALSIIKSLPLSYNIDLQELTPPVWLSVEEALRSLRVMRRVIEGVQFDTKRMYEAAELGFSSAVELANELVRQFGIPFRTAHRIVGRVVKEAIDRGLKPSEIEPKLLEEAAAAEGHLIKVNEEFLKYALNPIECINKCKILGGPSREAVNDMIKSCKLKLQEEEKMLMELMSKVAMIDEVLENEAKRLGVA